MAQKLYVCIIEIGRINMIAVASVDPDADEDEFQKNHFLVKCSHPTDMLTAQADMNLVCNVLANSGAAVVRS